MTKTEMREFAKEKLIESINWKMKISTYINQYGEAMAKAIHKNYFTM